MALFLKFCTIRTYSLQYYNFCFSGKIMEVIKYRYKDIDIDINTGRYIDRSPIF